MPAFKFAHIHRRTIHASASRNIPPPLSTVHRGIQFEERCLALLEREFSMTLRRIGGKSDGGVDLVGWWWLPAIPGLVPTRSGGQDVSLEEGLGQDRCRVRVLAQCKAEKKKVGPAYVREMEGVLNRYRYRDSNELSQELPDLQGDAHENNVLDRHAGAELPSDHKRHRSVGILISQSAFTQEAILRAMSAHVPMLLLSLPSLSPSGSHPGETENNAQPLGSAIWNPALGGPKGLLRGELEMRWEWSVSGEHTHRCNVDGRPTLWWKGERLGNWIPKATT